MIDSVYESLKPPLLGCKINKGNGKNNEPLFRVFTTRIGQHSTEQM